MVIPMGWLNLPDFICAASETVSNNANGYALDSASTFVAYPLPTDRVYKTANSSTASTNHLQYVDVYIDDLVCAAQVDPNQQQRFFDLTICALKEIFSSLLDEVKDSDILNISLARDRDWETIKYILGWLINTHWG